MAGYPVPRGVGAPALGDGVDPRTDEVLGDGLVPGDGLAPSRFNPMISGL